MSPRPIRFRGNFINGRFVRPSQGRRIVSEDPGDLDCPVGEIRSDPSVVHPAVRAARRALAGWQNTSHGRRESLVKRYGRVLARQSERLARVISRETGKSLSESRAEVRAMIEKIPLTIREALPLVADRVFPMEKGARGAVRHRPRGVAAVIGPFNVPGHLPNGQIVPALLTGNTVVFKPSELTPFTGQAIVECLAAAGFPQGVINLVQGDGAAGARLAAHSDVDVVFFTGSVATGTRIRRTCFADPKKLVVLEMGGKNAALVLRDADVEAAVKETVHGAFSTTGQRCSSTSRIFVDRKIASRFVEGFLRRTDGLRIGYFTDDPDMGPLVRASSVEVFLEAQRAAERLGFKTLRRGERVFLTRRGHYVRPSVHLWEKSLGVLVKSGRRDYWDRELFAPDVAIYPADGEEEMLRGCNTSQYGLVASVFSQSEKTFRRLSPRIECGVVHWNRTTAMTPGRLPFGGIKASGNHWPAGLFVPYACTYPVGSVENAS
jgi:succinylglutamic semialdehyde dehydrogenase